MFRDVWDSLVRTFTPVVVGQIVAWLSLTGVELDPQFATSLTLLVGALCTGAYYLVARLLETFVTPKFGVLLGLTREPIYVARHDGDAPPSADVGVASFEVATG